MKRYVAEEGSDAVRRAMAESERWFTCRVTYVEASRAVTIAAGATARRKLEAEWPRIGIVEVDAALCEHAAALTGTHELRSLDALHLAAALVLEPHGELSLATWDRRLHRAAKVEGLALLPSRLD